jgi:hypothetical protein
MDEVCPAMSWLALVGFRLGDVVTVVTDAVEKELDVLTLASGEPIDAWCGLTFHEIVMVRWSAAFAEARDHGWRA